MVGKNIEDIAEHRVHITRPAVVQLFNEFGAKYESTVTENIDELIRNVIRNTNNTGGVLESEEGSKHTGLHTGGYRLWNYHGHFGKCRINLRYLRRLKVRGRGSCGFVDCYSTDTAFTYFSS